MSIHWLTIFLAYFIFINSDGLSVKRDRAEDGPWIDNDANNINHQSKEPNSLFEASNSGISGKISTAWNHQKTYQQKSYRHNNDEKVLSKKEYQDLLVAVLSKVAKIWTTKKNFATGEYLQNRISIKNTEEVALSNKQLSSKLPSYDTASNGETKRNNFYCQAIQKVYISTIETYIPSYACILGSKTFILASKRFYQDRRNSFYIHVDEDMIRKLNNSATFTKNQSNIIPAILALKPGDENYVMRNQ